MFYRYSKTHIARQAKEKYARVSRLSNKIESVEARIIRDCNVGSENRSLAVAALLVLRSGTRAGNAGQSHDGLHESFGAASLLTSHCTVDGDSIRLQYVGKKNVQQDTTFVDPIVAEYIRERQASNEVDLFPISANQLLRYMKSVGCSKTHDLRTLRGQLVAQTLADDLTKDGLPETKKEAKLLRKVIGIGVGSVLGNSASQALSSYIAPSIIPTVPQEP
jgi:DNA topoisomerase-1